MGAGEAIMGGEMTMELIYIGDHFYFESGTVMSSIYTIDGERYDWGFVSIALRSGKSVHIRPATKNELALYEKKLAALKKERGNG
jgi:hypothetical protein